MLKIVVASYICLYVCIYDLFKDVRQYILYITSIVSAALLGCMAPVVTRGVHEMVREE